MICGRCGNQQNVELHHVVYRSKGGSDADWNKQPLCKSCHDYRHTYEQLTDQIVKTSDRLKLLLYRLQVLEDYNPPELIREYGYTSYWIDPKTHGDKPEPKPRKKYKKRRSRKSS